MSSASQQMLLAVGAGEAAPDPVTLVSTLTSGSSNSTTIAAPSGINAGDLIILSDFAEHVSDGGTPTTVLPSNFTNISDVSGTIVTTGRRAKISYKIANGSEDGSNITGMDGSASSRKLIVVFQFSEPISSVSVSTISSSGITSANPAAQTTLSGSGDPPLIVLASYNGASGNTINPRTFTVGGVDAKDGEGNETTSSYLAWKHYASSPANVTADMDDEGINLVRAFYLELST